MAKIGKGITFLFCLGLVWAGASLDALAQNAPKVQATVSRTTVYTGGRLKLNVRISGSFNKVSLPDLPKIEGFKLLNSMPSTSRHFSYINGVTSTSYTYSYFLVAQKKGQYKIPPISIRIDGKQYQTQTIAVKIIERKAEADGEKKPGVFLKMELSDQTVVPGEQIIASIVLYFKNGIRVSTYQPIPGWKAEGFWKERLKRSKRPTVKPVIIDGVRYNKAKLLQFALFATKTGELTISPYTVNVTAQTVTKRQSPFSSFFGSFSANRKRMKLKTEPITVEVHSLPEKAAGKFIGAVGSFQVTRKISADTVKAGETIEIKTTISGTGNIPLITKPEYDYPASLEVYQPQTDVKIERYANHIEGKKVYTDIVVPRTPGKVTIPAATLSWFNPQKGTFIKEKLPAKTIFVTPGDQLATAKTKGPIGLNPVTGLVQWRQMTPKALVNYWWFWAGLLLPALGLGFGYWRKTHQEKMMNNSGYARSQKADNIVDQRLHKALEHAKANHVKQTYNNLQKALTGFIADKLNMPKAGLSIEQYKKVLSKNGVNKDLIENVGMLLKKCDTISYAPGQSSDYLKSHVGLAESIIKKLKKEL